MLSSSEAKERIVKRIARELKSEDKMLYVNLGVGTPTLVADYIDSKNIFIQSENGMLGVGPKADETNYDDQIINAGRQVVTELDGCCYFDSSMSFGMIRSGQIDVTVLGAFEVDEVGNIANWIIPGGKQLGVGGAMDLVTGVSKVIIAMRHTDRDGKPKLKKSCTLPITGFNDADMVVTEYAVFYFENNTMILSEIFEDISVERLRDITEASFIVADDLKIMCA